MCRFTSLFFLQTQKGSISGAARDFNNIQTRAANNFFLQWKARKEIHAILTETLGEHATSYATLYKRGDVSTCDAPRFVQAKTVTKTEIIDQIHEVVL